MNFRKLKVGSIIGAAVVPVLGLLLLTSSAALADGPFGKVTAWEIQEFLLFKTGDDEDSIIRRLATATLVGHATDGLCALVGQNPCAIDGRAQSSVDVSTGVGTITGTFDILLDTNPDGPLLMDLVLAGKVKLHGTLDLRPAFLFMKGMGGAPVALASGTWRSRELGAQGGFTATFLIPIPSPACSPPLGLGFAYYNPLASPLLFQCLTPNDFSLGAPVVKAVADLTKESRGKRHHGDD